MKKIIKYLVITTIVVVGIMLIIHGVLTGIKNKKAQELFGDTYCEYNGEHPKSEKLVPIDDSKCKLCNKNSAPNTELCESCAKQTHRCKCGKKLK